MVNWPMIRRYVWAAFWAACGGAATSVMLQPPPGAISEPPPACVESNITTTIRSFENVGYCYISPWAIEWTSYDRALRMTLSECHEAAKASREPGPLPIFTIPLD